MTDRPTMILTGASGREYKFTVYPADTIWKEDYACVYFVSQRAQKPDGDFNHFIIYIGQTECVKTRHGDHHKQRCFDRNKYNCISLKYCEDEEERLQIEADLVAAYKPPCNA